MQGTIRYKWGTKTNILQHDIILISIKIAPNGRCGHFSDEPNRALDFYQLNDSTAKNRDDWQIFFSSYIVINDLIILEVALFYEVSNLPAHQRGNDFSGDLIIGEPDVEPPDKSNENRLN